MATATVIVERNDHVAEFNSIFSTLGQQYMGLAVQVAKGAVQRNSPVDRGIFRGGIATQVLEQVLDVGSKISGVVYSQDEPIKVEVIESGRGIGKKFPPVDVIREWVRRVLGGNVLASITTGEHRISKAAARREAKRTARSPFGPQNTPENKAINRVAYLIGRKIYLEGIAGRHVFQKSFEQVKSETDRLLGPDLTAALARRV